MARLPLDHPAHQALDQAWLAWRAVVQTDPSDNHAQHVTEILLWLRLAAGAPDDERNIEALADLFKIARVALRRVWGDAPSHVPGKRHVDGATVAPTRAWHVRELYEAVEDDFAAPPQAKGSMLGAELATPVGRDRLADMIVLFLAMSNHFGTPRPDAANRVASAIAAGGEAWARTRAILIAYGLTPDAADGAMAFIKRAAERDVGGVFAEAQAPVRERVTEAESTIRAKHTKKNSDRKRASRTRT